MSKWQQLSKRRYTLKFQFIYLKIKIIFKSVQLQVESLYILKKKIRNVKVFDISPVFFGLSFETSICISFFFLLQNSSLVGSKFLPVCGYVILLCSTMGLGRKTAFYIILQFIQLSHHIMQMGLAFQDPQSCSKPMPELGVIQQIYYACVALSLW